MCWRMGSPTGSRNAMSAAIAQRPLASALLWFLSRSIVEGLAPGTLDSLELVVGWAARGFMRSPSSCVCLSLSAASPQIGRRSGGCVLR